MTWTPERHAQARARAAAATEGPWDHFEDDWGSGWAVAHEDGFPGRTYIAQDIQQRGGVVDAEFIAHARQDVPDMLGEIDRLTRALADARTVTEDMVERAARALWGEREGISLDDESESVQDFFRGVSRHVLKAALNPEGEE